MSGVKEPILLITASIASFIIVGFILMWINPILYPMFVIHENHTVCERFGNVVIIENNTEILVIDYSLWKELRPFNEYDMEFTSNYTLEAQGTGQWRLSSAKKIKSNLSSCY